MLTDVEIDKALLEFRPLADWWANKVQWKEEDHNDLVQEGLLELLKTLRGYQRSGKEIRDLKGLASTVLSAAMRWSYKPVDRFVTTVSLEKAEIASKIQKAFRTTSSVGLIPPGLLQVQVDGVDEYIGAIWLQEYIAEVGRVMGRTAELVVQNLLFPSEEIVEMAIAEMEKKVERKKAGERVVGHSTLRITKEHIRVFTKLTEAQWQIQLEAIRRFTRQYLERGLVRPPLKAEAVSPNSLEN